MRRPFRANMSRFDPYKPFRFLVYFGQSNDAVAGVSKVTGLKRTSDAIEYRAGGSAVILKGLGRTKYEAITLERGLTHDTEFQEWADAAQTLVSGVPTQSLKNLRKDIRLVLLNEAGQPAIGYMVYRCWVSEYQALPDLDAGSNAVALEHIKLENEGWERDPAVKEPQEV